MNQVPPFPTTNLPPQADPMMMGMNDPTFMPSQYPMSTPNPPIPFTHTNNTGGEILQPNDFVSNINYPMQNFDQPIPNFGTHMAPPPNMGDPMGTHMGDPMGTHMGDPMGTHMGPNIVYLPEEIAYYNNLWKYMDPQDQGTVDINTANAFLKKSGLSTSTLFQIGNIAMGGPNSTGLFDQNMFCLACRLIALAQNQFPLNSEALYQAPPSLPFFDMSDSPNASMITEVKPITTIDPEFTTSNMAKTDTNNQRETRGHYWIEMIKRLPLNTFDENMYIISEELQLKYRHLFNLNDIDADGYLKGSEGRDIFAHSGLTPQELSLIWKLADVDDDGRLNLNEFAVCVHLVNCRLNDMPIPDVLPNELAKIIRDGLVTTTSKKDKDYHDGKPSPEMGPSKTSDEKMKALTENSKQIFESANAFSQMDLKSVSPAITNNLFTSDRAISKNLGLELNEYENDITTLRQNKEEIEYKLMSVKQNIAKQIDTKNKLKKLVEDEREHFEHIKSERRMLDLEKIGLNRDIEHYKEELEFLKAQVNDAHSDINYLSNLNTQMDANYNRTEKQIASLHTSRKNITNNLKNERANLAQDEREIIELRDTLQRLQRDKEDAKAHNAVIQERLRQAEQDRMIIISSIETERQKLLATKDSRIKLANDKQNLIDQISEYKTEVRAIMQNTENYTHTRTNTNRNVPVSYGQRPRDSKGIPANEPTHRPNIYTRANNESYKSEVGNQNRWAQFGTSVRSFKEEMAKDEHDTVSISKFMNPETETSKPNYETKNTSYKPSKREEEISSIFDNDALDFNEITEGANDWKTTTNSIDITPNDPFSYK